MITTTLLIVAICSNISNVLHCNHSVTLLDTMRQCESAGQWIEANARTASKALKVVWTCQENVR